MSSEEAMVSDPYGQGVEEVEGQGRRDRRRHTADPPADAGRDHHGEDEGEGDVGVVQGAADRHQHRRGGEGQQRAHHHTDRLSILLRGHDPGVRPGLAGRKALKAVATARRAVLTRP